MNNNYSFQKFTSFNSRSAEQTVTITKNNTIGISSAFAEEHNLDKYNFAVLYYDRVASSIGIKFVNDRSEAAKFSLTRAQVGKGASIIAHSFFKKNNIQVEKYAGSKYFPKKLNARKDLNLNEPGSIFVIDLREPFVKDASGEKK